MQERGPLCCLEYQRGDETKFATGAALTIDKLIIHK